MTHVQRLFDDVLCVRIASKNQPSLDTPHDDLVEDARRANISSRKVVGPGPGEAIPLCEDGQKERTINDRRPCFL